MTISPAIFPAITVTVVRDRKIRTALRTNQIAGFVTVPSWKKIMILMMLLLEFFIESTFFPEGPETDDSSFLLNTGIFFVIARSPSLACNSHTKPMSWHFYKLVYFWDSFSGEIGQFRSTRARIARKKWLTSHQKPITFTGEIMTSLKNEVLACDWSLRFPWGCEFAVTSN